MTIVVKLQYFGHSIRAQTSACIQVPSGARLTMEDQEAAETKMDEWQQTLENTVVECTRTAKDRQC